MTGWSGPATSTGSAAPATRRKVQIRVSAAAIDLGWTFFGPLLTSMIAAMPPCSPAELDTVERFLHEVAAVVRWPAAP